MATIGALANLTSVGGYFQIYNNNSTAFTTVAGLASLTTVGTTKGGYLNIQSNGSLVNLDGLAKLTSVGTWPNDYLADLQQPVSSP